MENEKREELLKILSMVEDGTLTPEEAEAMLAETDAEDPDTERTETAEPGETPENAESSENAENPEEPGTDGQTQQSADFFEDMRGQIESAAREIRHEAERLWERTAGVRGTVSRAAKAGPTIIGNYTTGKKPHEGDIVGDIEGDLDYDVHGSVYGDIHGSVISHITRARSRAISTVI